MRMEMVEFWQIIDNIGLSDIPLLGKFTWLSQHDQAMSRLDKIILSEVIIELWNDGGQFGEKNDT